MFFVSTYTDGQPPESAAWFSKWLGEAALDFRVAKTMLQGLSYTVVALGSSAYQPDVFCKVSTMCLLLPPYLFALLFRVGVSDKLPPHIPVVRLLPRQSLLPQVHIHTVRPTPLRSTSPPPLYIHPIHDFPYIFSIPTSIPL